MEKHRKAVFEENTTVRQTSKEDRMTEINIFLRKMTVRMNRINMYMKTLHKWSVAVIQMIKLKVLMKLKLSTDGIVNMMIIPVFIIMVICHDDWIVESFWFRWRREFQSAWLQYLVKLMAFINIYVNST